MALDSLLARNAEWAKTWKNPFDMAERHAAAVRSGSVGRRSSTPGEVSGGLIR